MNLRNINDANDRYMGSVYGGVDGSTVPTTGTDGGGFLSAAIAADQTLLTKKVRGKITRMPATGVLLADDDSSFTFVPAGPGTESFDYQKMVDDVPVGDEKTVNLVSGNGGVIGTAKSTMVRMINWLRRVGF